MVRLASLLLIVCVLSIATVVTASAQDGTISGVVYQADGKAPVPRARVGVMPSDNVGTRSGGCADDQGRYSVPVEYGSYKLFARGGAECNGDPNFAYQYYGETLIFEEATVLSVTPATPNPTGIDFSLDEGGSLSGGIYNDSGKDRLPGGLIVFRSAADHRINQWTCAEEDGSYVLSGIPFGEHEVFARGYCGIDSRYTRVFWKDAPSGEDASLVKVNESEREYSGIDFSLTLGGSLSGAIYSPDGKTLSDATISVQAIGSSAGAQTVKRGMKCPRIRELKCPLIIGVDVR